MFKTIIAAALLAAAPAIASAQAPAPVLDRMAKDWADFDAACRGTSPSQGADGFCGARAYIGWVLAENGRCLNENAAQGGLWIACNTPGAYATPDPIGADLRADF